MPPDGAEKALGIEPRDRHRDDVRARRRRQAPGDLGGGSEERRARRRAETLFAPATRAR